MKFRNMLNFRNIKSGTLSDLLINLSTKNSNINHCIQASFKSEFTAECQTV